MISNIWWGNYSPFHIGLDFWNLIEVVLVFPLHVNTTYGSDNPLESTETKLLPSIKAIVRNHPSPYVFIPWSIPNISRKINITTHTWALNEANRQ